jgi:hypothetical protein
LRPVTARRSNRTKWIAPAIVVLALGIAACGRESNPTSANANNNGSYVDAGPITYQLQVSRELNPWDVEDSEYLRGLSNPTSTLTPSQLWYGVFLWAKNQTGSKGSSTDSFDIIDTQGNVYHPISIDTHINPYTWQPQQLNASEQQPSLGSTPYYGPTQGEMLLFKLDNSVYSNRPLTLRIYAPGQSQPSTISLDL